MVYGKRGKYGIVSNVESVSYRQLRASVGSNPTLSAINYHIYKHLHEYIYDSVSTLSLNNFNVISMLLTIASITCSIVYEFIRIWPT
jgi:hypothetical protein